MKNKKECKQFRDSGLLWWTNMILHTFGWAIVMEFEFDEVIDVYVKRVKYRGFEEKINTSGYIKVSKYMKEHAEELIEEAME